MQFRIVLSKVSFVTLRGERFLVELRRAGLKLTPQRIAIVQELADDASHPTAQSLFERLRPAFPTMSFATVYNTLDALARCGLVRSLDHAGCMRFDPNSESHDHAICDSCGDILDVPAASADVPSAVAATGFHVTREQRTYRGLCRRCASQSLS